MHAVDSDIRVRCDKGLESVVEGGLALCSKHLPEMLLGPAGEGEYDGTVRHVWLVRLCGGYGRVEFGAGDMLSQVL